MPKPATECDSLFARWHRKGSSKRKAHQTEIDFGKKDDLIDLLDRGRHRRDSDKSVIDELGFHIGMWNGKKSTKMVGLSVTCGQYTTVPGLGGNSVLLELPEDLGALQDSDRVEKVLVAIAKCWEPDWAGVFSVDAMHSRDFSVAVPFVDWMVYVGSKKCEIPCLPSIFGVHKVNDHGSIIVVQAAPPQPDDVAHIEKVKAVELAIGSLLNSEEEKKGDASIIQRHPPHPVASAADHGAGWWTASPSPAPATTPKRQSRRGGTAPPSGQ